MTSTSTGTYSPYPSFFLGLATWPAIYKEDRTKNHGALETLANRFFLLISLVMLIICCIHSHHKNYINGGLSNVTKITVNECNIGAQNTETCEFVGMVTYRPFLPELKIITTPLYPILNCPIDSCVQEEIFVDKKKVVEIVKLR